MDMGKIEILDEHIANQIAAGEVVERPASIVKELVENSIDAGSTQIEIEIEEGGLSSIRVADNGEGLLDEDVEKAFLRHATSKLKSGNDLFKITSLGFRGEALPSIAAVSRLTLRTATKQDGHGLEVNFEGGTLKGKQSIAFNKGTEIIVKDIFFNTPARLKYLKSLQTEIGHIIDYVNRLSLSYPNIAFTLIHNNRPVLRTNGDQQLLHVLTAIYGTSVAKSMIPIENEDKDFKIHGYISKPEITRANKNHISFFVNGRFIKHYLLTQAMIKGYDTLLMINRFPVAVINIELEPSLIDVNVHPAKLEVRFSKEQELMKLLEQTIRQRLHEQNFVRQIDFDAIQHKKEKIQTEQSTINLYRSHQDTNLSNLQYEHQSTNNTKLETFEEEKNPFHTEEFIPFNHRITTNTTNNKLTDDDYTKNEPVNKLSTARLPMLEPISQFNGTYLVAQGEDGLYLIDQHAAHERINYEKNLLRMNEEVRSSQELLVPITIDFSKSEALQINKRIELLQSYGLEIEPFGQHSFIIRAVPSWIPSGDELFFIEGMIEQALENDKINLEDLRKDLIANTSCKTSIKANHYLTKKEMESLLDELRKTNNPFSCPHGRPIVVNFSLREIEKMFKRVV